MRSAGLGSMHSTMAAIKARGVNAQGEVVLVAIYAKAKFDNMPVSVLKTWKEAFDA